MHLRFNTDRLLARLAAEASKASPRDGAVDRERPWQHPPTIRPPSTPTPLDRAAADTGQLAVGDPRRDRLEAAIGATVVGDPASAGRVLTVDAACWSPWLSFTSRSEAEDALAAQPGALAVEEFRVGSLWWCEPVAIAEWHVHASLVGPLLVGDEVLVDRPGQRVDVCGASIAAFRGDRIAAMHTYLDEATVIEQVLLARRQ